MWPGVKKVSITISLWSTEQGEILRFLESFYQKNIKIEACSRRWIKEFYNPLDSIDIISALMDNNYKYEILMYIHMENGYLHKITTDNYNDIIKDILKLFYLPVK